MCFSTHFLSKETDLCDNVTCACPVTVKSVTES